MPAQQRRWLDQERAPPLPRQQLAERRQQDTIGRPQPRPPDLAAQHLQLMPQHQDLKLLRPLRTTKKNQQLEQTANNPVSEGQTPKEQTSSMHLATLPARTTPSYSSLSVHARPRRSGARVSGTTASTTTTTRRCARESGRPLGWRHHQGQLDPEDAREQHQRRRALFLSLHRPGPPRRRGDATHRVGFVNSAVADLQGNRAGARVALVADRVAAVMLAMAAQPLAQMVSSGGKGRAERLGRRRAGHLLGREPHQRREGKAPRHRPRRRRLSDDWQTLTHPLESLSAVRRDATLRPNYRRPGIYDFPGNPLRPNLRTPRAYSSQTLCVSVFGALDGHQRAAEILSAIGKAAGVELPQAEPSIVCEDRSHGDVLNEKGAGRYPPHLTCLFAGGDLCSSWRASSARGSAGAAGEGRGNRRTGRSCRPRATGTTHSVLTRRPDGRTLPCRLTIWDGRREPRLYWSVAKRLFEPDVLAVPRRPCPFSNGRYQLMRNITFASEFARLNGLPKFGMVVAYVAGSPVRAANSVSTQG
jgi:hypothetical protein